MGQINVRKNKDKMEISHSIPADLP
ncbi:uncharacterized protein G2W53_013369 [Senna tora]|uniref:Uncharacterized protein n=1 Tax=Senna tora TaxID=362788 RepID=A0A834WS66_9FABA|nr:uncharacterized protein G2W53_013369 [Senna tora]